MKNKTGLFLLTAFLALVLIGTFFNIPAPDRAFAASKAVTGYAWSENIGWIHFNPVIGGVFLDDSTGNFSGYAWSENIGWVDFGPAGGFPATPNYGAKMDLPTGAVTGWAKAVAGGSAESGGWDGWIKMSGSAPNYGVNIDFGTGNFSGWAWASDVVGWISFSGNTSGAGGGDYKVTVSPLAPVNPTGLSAVAGAVCETIDLSWNDNADNETSYRVERKTIGVFSEIASLPANSTTYTNTGLTGGTSYTYRVRACNVNATECSGYSNEKSATAATCVAVPDFSLNNSGAILATIIGGSVQVSGGSLISVLPQNGFSDSVSLSIISVNPVIAGANSNLNDLLLTSAEYAVGSTLTVSNIPASVSPGTYVITVQGVGGGITRTITVNLQIETLNPTWREI